MSTIVSLPDQSTAKLPAKSYLNQEYGLKSWLLTGDHKRIAMLYLFSITFLSSPVLTAPEKERS